MGGAPMYPIVVFNFRTSTKIVEHNTYIVSGRYSLTLGNGAWPTIVQYDDKTKRISCYEVCFEKTAYLHQTSDVEMGKSYMLSGKYCRCFGDDNLLYTVNDFGEFSQIIISCSAIERRWTPSTVDEKGAERSAYATSLTLHRSGFVIANSHCVYYIKKKSNHFVVEWTIKSMQPEAWGTFVSNANGELYMAREPGNVCKMIVEESEGRLQSIITMSRPVLAYCSLNCFKEECVVVLHNDGIAMMDLPYGKVLSEVPIPESSAISSHRTNAYVCVGTLNAHVLLIHFEKPSQANIVYDLECDSAGVVAMEFYDNTIVYRDQMMNFHVLNIEYRPIKLSTFFSIDDDLLKFEVLVHSFLLVEGPRLLVMITRDLTVTAPAVADEMWIFTWGKDKRLHRREFPLPNSYVSFTVNPPMGRWVAIEIVGAVKSSTIIDQYMLSETNELQWTATIKTTHFGQIIGVGMTKHLMTWGVEGLMVQFRQHKRAKRPFIMSRFVTICFDPELIVKAREVYNSK